MDLTAKVSQCETSSLIIQLIIVISSLLCCLFTIGLICYHRLQKDPFAFLILATQLCYTLIAIIDLLSKIFRHNPPAAKQWCQIATPFVYGMILSSFLYIEIFCYMIYQTIRRQYHGYINKNIRRICFIIWLVAIAINYIGYPYYDLGICENCTFMTPQHQEALSILMTIVSYIDYFGPIVLLFPIGYLMRKLYNYYNTNSLDKKQLSTIKILALPLGNFIFLLLNNIISIQQLQDAMRNQMKQWGYILLYESLYYVPFINLYFYRQFVVSFGLYERDDRVEGPFSICVCPCAHQEEPNDLLLTYYETRRNNEDE